MTADWGDLAEVLRWLLVLAGAVWIIYAWFKRVAYRRALLGLVGLAALDFCAHAFATYAARPDSIIPDDLPVYSLFILLAAVIGLLAACIYARSTALPLSTLLDAALVVVICGSAGARIYHVLTHWDYYQQNTGDILNFAQGGLGLSGGVILGLAALALWALVRRVSFWPLADAGALGLALAQSIGWNAARLVGANYGVVSDAGFAQDLPDVYGIVAPRVPVQGFAMIFFFMLFLTLVWIAWRIRPRAGIVFLVYLIVAALGGLVLGTLRGDETLIWNGWRVDQWVDLILVAIGLVVLVTKMRTWRLPARETAK